MRGLDWSDLDTKAIAFLRTSGAEARISIPQLSTFLWVRQSRNSRVRRNDFSAVCANVGGTAVAQATS